MATIVKASNVSKKFGHKLVLDGVSFEIHKGEIVGLIGENGAGKSTLINIMLGLDSPSTGQVNLFDKKNDDRSVKDKVGVMFQDSYGLSRIRGTEMVELVRSCFTNPLPTTTINELAGLGSDMRTMVLKMSGGQRRKLNFALAMAGDPDILFLDEPTAGMDSTSRYEFWNHVRQLSQAGKTIFVTSHYLEEIEDIASRIIFLKNHQILFDGTMANLKNQFTKSIVEFDTRKPEKEIIAYVHTGSLDSDNQGHYTFTTDDPDKLIQELVPVISEIQHIKITQNTLDQIFREVMKEGQN